MQQSSELALGKSSFPSRHALTRSFILSRAGEWLARYGWLLTGATCLLLGYLFVWNRGFYFDDYLFKANAIDVITGEEIPLSSPSRLRDFPARILSSETGAILNSMLPEMELPVRVLIALSVGLDALLAGLLVHRFLRSRLAAVVGGWLFLMPLFAQEAVLWTGASDYVFGCLFILVFLHASWNALRHSQNALRYSRNARSSLQSIAKWIGLATLALIASLQFRENFISAVGLLPFFGVALAAQPRPPRYRQMLQSSLLLLAWFMAVLGLSYFLLYHNSTTLAMRGGMDATLTGLLARGREYGEKLQWMTVSPEWGQRVLRELFRLGTSTLFQSWMSLALLALAIIFLALTTLTWRDEVRPNRPTYRVGFIGLIAGAAWFVASLLFPSVLVKGQILEYRMLYFPTAAAILTIASLVFLITRALAHPIWGKLVLALSGVLLLYSTISMLGYARALELRSQVDRAQIEALVRVLPSEYLPPDTTIVTFNTGQLLAPETNTLSKLLVGVLDTPWSAQAAVEQAYHRRDFQVLNTNQWVRIRFGVDEDAPFERLRVMGATTPPKGAVVPVQQTVLVRYYKGNAYAIEHLVLTRADGTSVVLDFPIAQALRAHGLPTIERSTFK